MINPDKHIRKFFVDTLNNIEVDGKTITIHDYRVPQNKDAYILMINQSMDPNYDNKCGKYRWTCRITLDIVTIYKNNQGSRLLADNIKEEVMSLTKDIDIDNFLIENQEMTFPDDLHFLDNTQSIFRKLINYELILIEN